MKGEEPQMNTDEHGLNELTEKVIGCAFRVSNKLGCGFLEKCYENAMGIELGKAGLRYVPQKAIKVLYDGFVIGDYFGDIVVEDIALIELKTVKAFTSSVCPNTTAH